MNLTQLPDLIKTFISFVVGKNKLKSNIIALTIHVQNLSIYDNQYNIKYVVVAQVLKVMQVYPGTGLALYAVLRR